MKEFVFGILTYNQENYILETLESIKYQKIHYGEEREISLIITDDASKDQTVAVIAQWLDENSSFFAETELIVNSKNQGTVANFCTIVDKAGKRDFKVIAGDDLIAHTDLFAEYLDLDEKKLKTYFRVELCNGKVSYREKYLIEFYYHKMHKKGREYYLKNFRKGRYLHTPSTLYSLELFHNAECKKNLEGYRLYEDDPMWYSMIKNEKDLSIEFVPQAIVLYRMHAQSVSNVPNPIFREDQIKLSDLYMKEAKGVEKIYLLLRRYAVKWPVYLKPTVYVDKLVNTCRKWVCKSDPSYLRFKEKIEKQIQEEQKFYNEILSGISNRSVLE